MKWVLRTVLALAGLGVLALLAWGAWPKPVAVDFVTVQRGPLRVEVEEDGKARVEERYVLSAPVAGVVARSDLWPGDPVHEGQVLARIQPIRSPLLDPRTQAEAEARVRGAEDAEQQARASLARARAAHEQALTELERTERLADAGAATARELVEAQATARIRKAEQQSAASAVQVAEHETEAARAAAAVQPRSGEADPVDIVSPVNGEVLRVVQRDEATVSPGAPLVEVGDPAALEIAVDLLTADAARVAPGMAASLDGWGGGELRAWVRRVEPSAFTRVSPLGVEEQRVNVILDLADDPAKALSLRDGFSVNARITVSELGSTLKVPLSAVFRRGTGWATYGVDGGRARLRPVTLGERSTLEAQVLEGLREGEEVIAYPPETLKDGSRVVPKT